MVEVVFAHKQIKTAIQANLDDSFSEIANKFIDKSHLDLKGLCFLSNGKNIKQNEIIKDIMNESEKKNKKMIILVYSINNPINIGNTNIIQSKAIICPICKDNCIYEIKEHKIKLSGCKNGHVIDDIKLKKENKCLNMQKERLNVILVPGRSMLIYILDFIIYLMDSVIHIDI